MRAHRPSIAPMTDTFPDAPRPPAPEHGSGTTLGLIAREANVSIGTVSKVLNGRKGISPRRPVPASRSSWSCTATAGAGPSGRTAR